MTRCDGELWYYPGNINNVDITKDLEYLRLDDGFPAPISDIFWIADKNYFLVVQW